MLTTEAKNTIQKSFKEVLYLPNTLKEFKEIPLVAKGMFFFLIAGILIYFAIMQDFSGWGFLSLFGLLFSALNLVLVDSGKVTSFLWGLLTVTCCLVGAIHYSMLGDVAYYLWCYPWLLSGIVTWFQLKDQGSTTVSKKLPLAEVPKYIALFIGSYVVMFTIATLLGGTTPAINSLILSFGVLGQVFLSKSYREQWIVWIMQNTVGILNWGYVLYLAVLAGESIIFPASMLLNWSIFMVNAIYGTIVWYKNSNR